MDSVLEKKNEKKNIISFTVHKDRFSASFTQKFFMSLFSPWDADFVYNIEHLLIINFDIKIFNSFINNIHNGVVFFFSSPELKAWTFLIVYCTSKYTFHVLINLTKVRPLFTLSHRGSNNSPLLIMFSANYIDQSDKRNLNALQHFWRWWNLRFRVTSDMSSSQI